MSDYLEHSKYIDWKTEPVLSVAKTLAEGETSEEGIVRRCFHFVRDEIRHSLDYELNPVTCRASEVLEHRTGYCYAKSHLLAALLRANGIPAGLCYQRLLLAPDGDRFCLHGLNAVSLKETGWYRVDPRGNKPGVRAEFSPPLEQLAFEPNAPGESDLPGILVSPHEQVINVLEGFSTFREVEEHLPDIDV